MTDVPNGKAYPHIYGNNSFFEPKKHVDAVLLPHFSLIICSIERVHSYKEAPGLIIDLAYARTSLWIPAAYL